MDVKVEWQGGMAFLAESGDGKGFLMDAVEVSGGEGKGVSPVDAMMASLAGCSGMDVISILRKKKQNVTSYRMEVEGERGKPTGEYPNPYTKMTIKHYLKGENLDEKAVKRAIELTDEKYCTVLATLREEVEVKTEYELE
jgi:putative redox protein